MKKHAQHHKRRRGQEYSPLLQSYLHFMREREVLVLILVFVFVEVVAVAFTFNSFREHRRDQLLRSMKESKNYSGLADHYQRLLKADPQNAEANYYCAYYAYKLRDYPLTLTRAKWVEQNQADQYRFVFCLIAKCYYYQNRIKEATPYIAVALKLNSYDNELRLIVADQLLKAGLLAEGAEWLTRCIDDTEFGAKARAALRELELQLHGELARISDDNFEPLLLENYDASGSAALPDALLHPALSEYLKKTIP